jgi:hypothetical protein
LQTSSSVLLFFFLAPGSFCCLLPCRFVCCMQGGRGGNVPCVCVVICL